LAVALTDCCPALSGGIGHVLCARAEKQVVRVDARAIVATVANIHPRWDFTSVKPPSGATCGFLRPF
jgi:hypothetical protein